MYIVLTIHLFYSLTDQMCIIHLWPRWNCQGQRENSFAEVAVSAIQKDKMKKEDSTTSLQDIQKLTICSSCISFLDFR